MQVSFHNHTEYSHDCTIRLSELEKRCVQRGIDAIAITDHHTIKGAVKAAELFTKVRVIIGQEIETESGEIIGLFLRDEVARGLSFEASVQAVHAQGGIVIVPHPFDRLRRHVLDLDVLQNRLADIDVVEVFNARTVFADDNRVAAVFAKEHDKLTIVGNDAHTLSEVGKTIIEIEDFSDSSSFLKSLKKATFTTKTSPLWVHVVTKVVKLRYWLSKLGAR